MSKRKIYNGKYFCEVVTSQTIVVEDYAKNIPITLWFDKFEEVKKHIKSVLSKGIVEIILWNTRLYENRKNLLEVNKIISHIKLGQYNKLENVIFVQGGKLLYSGNVNNNKETKKLIHILKELYK